MKSSGARVQLVALSPWFPLSRVVEVAGRRVWWALAALRSSIGFVSTERLDLCREGTQPWSGCTPSLTYKYPHDGDVHEVILN